MKQSTFLCLAAVCVALFFPTAHAVAEPNAADLLARADEYRNFRGKSFTFDLALTNIDDSQSEKSFGMKAEIRDSHTSLVVYTAPESERGKALLMDGNNLWFSSPGVSKPIRITPQQRLIGEASNGDVASTDFSGDYDPALLGREAVDGTPSYKLELTAKPGAPAAYSRLYLWIKADGHAPLKAEFFGPSGKLLKSAYYTKFEPLAHLGGKPQLVELEIVNALNPNKRTIMKYGNFRVGDVPESHFSMAYLSKLR